ncbi:site-specific DNA-methyltransferase [Flavobacterium zepuense]|uniref:Methyltransferase n=2 Tax=Flavobacterium zepuense TaxID=2593302 RepID=A0A552UV61_9FLAO|nr:site-specific DNA-methyltransferase [Flavobacterium zepuense]
MNWEENLLLQGDCLLLLPKLEDRSVDMVLCDLPYGTTECNWDKKLDLELLWQQYNRIIKDNGIIVFTTSQPFTTELINSNRKDFKYEWIWVKSNCTGFQHAKNRPLKNHETIIVFSKGSMGHQNLLGDKRMVYNPQGLVRVNKISRSKGRRPGTIIGPRPSHKSAYLTEFKNYPKTVFHFDNEKGLHPTQKPVPLFEYLVKTYSKEGGVVLDNCAGSGTTAIACLNARRKFILIEKDRKYIPVIIERVDKHIISLKNN